MSREWHTLGAKEQALIASHQASAPVRLSAIAKDLGLVVKAATLPAGISGEIRPDETTPARFIIRVNRHDSEGRQRFTVAHELAHFLLHREQIGSGIRDDALYRSSLSDRREAEANRLAANILMPHHLVHAALAEADKLGIEDKVAYAAEKLNVSTAAMKVQLNLD